MKQSTGVTGMAKEDKQTLVADEQSPLPSTVIVIPDRVDGSEGKGARLAEGWTCHYVLSILATCFCFGPLSVLGLAHFLSARQQARNGDLESAKKQKRAAAGWTISAVVVGVVSIIAIIVTIWVMAGVVYDNTSEVVESVASSKQLTHDNDVTTWEATQPPSASNEHAPNWEWDGESDTSDYDYPSSTPWYINDGTSIEPERATWEDNYYFSFDEQTTEAPTMTTAAVETTTSATPDPENYSYNYDDLATETDESEEEQFLAELEAEEKPAEENIGGSNIEQLKPANEELDYDEQFGPEVENLGTDQQQLEVENAAEGQIGSDDDAAADDINNEEEAELEAEEEELAAEEEVFDEGTTTTVSTTAEIPEDSALEVENLGADTEQFEPEVADFGDDEQFEPEDELNNEDQFDLEAENLGTDQEQLEPENAVEGETGFEDDAAAGDINTEVEEAELEAEEEELAADEEGFDEGTTTAETPEDAGLEADDQEITENLGADNEQLEPEVEDFSEDQFEPEVEDFGEAEQVEPAREGDDENLDVEDDVITDDLNTGIEEETELSADEEDAELEAENEIEAELEDDEEQLAADQQAEEEPEDEVVDEAEEASTTATDAPAEPEIEVEIVKSDVKNKTEADVNGEVQLPQDSDEAESDKEAPEVNMEEDVDDLTKEEEQTGGEMLNQDEFQPTTAGNPAVDFPL